MGTERFWKIHWAVAVWHNVIGGVGLLFLGDWVYQREGLQPPVPGVNYVRWMLLILVFAYMYFMVYKDLYNTEKLVRAGILGKVASATPDLYYLLFQTGVAKIFWITVCTDYLFAITFFLFLRWVRQQKDLMARPATPAYFQA
jgi:hypothetical protein